METVLQLFQTSVRFRSVVSLESDSDFGLLRPESHVRGLARLADLGGFY